MEELKEFTYIQKDNETEQRPTEEIKPCPICGKSDNILIRTKSFFDKLVENSENHSACLTMKCYNCALELYNHCDSTDYSRMRSYLINKWNTRKEVTKNESEED